MKMLAVFLFLSLGLFASCSRCSEQPKQPIAEDTLQTEAPALDATAATPPPVDGQPLDEIKEDDGPTPADEPGQLDDEYPETQD